MINFEVAEYRRPEFQLDLKSDPGNLLPGDSFKVDLAAAYYSGGGLSGADVGWTLRSEPYTFTSPSAYSGYSFSNAAYDNWDYYRSRHRWEELKDFPVVDQIDEVDTAENLAPYIREVVQSLPDPYREALLLTTYQGLSQQQLAERLGISLSGAKSRVQRARQKVRDVMLCCCHFELDAYGLVYEVRERCCKCAG